MILQDVGCGVKDWNDLAQDRDRWLALVNAVMNDSNKPTNQTQQFHKFITWRLCVAQHVSGASSSIISSLQLYLETTTNNAATATLQR
jgi:hypothetical protein